jgi:hypothetical protein
MYSEFDFLRLKWPKMARWRPTPGRLVEISPSRGHRIHAHVCEWAAAIALYMSKVQVMPCATQVKKLEACRPPPRSAEILQKFHNIRTAGNDAVHRALATPRRPSSLLETKKSASGFPRKRFPFSTLGPLAHPAGPAGWPVSEENAGHP